MQKILFFSKIILHKIQFKNKHERTQFENIFQVNLLLSYILSDIFLKYTKYLKILQKYLIHLRKLNHFLVFQIYE